jgi:DNA-binding IclR family transcriptional regulator
LLPVLDVLQSERQGLTLHQLACRLSAPPEGVRALLDRLVERQAVGTLNTVIPTYIYRGGGIEL